MSKNYKSSEIYLNEMIEACDKISEYVSRTTKGEFLKQKESFDAICLQFSHLGEQINHLEKSPDRIIQHYSDEVDWFALRGLRNKINHAYSSIDVDMIWEFASNQVTTISDELVRIRKKRFGI